MMNKTTKERTLETHLRYFNTYKVAIANCEKQLEWIMPRLVSQFTVDNGFSVFHIGNNTERVAIDRIESKRALDLREEIEKNKIIVESIELAFSELKDQEQDFVKLRYFECLPMHEVKKELGYAEEKSIYRIRRHVLDKLLISLNNL